MLPRPNTLMTAYIKQIKNSNFEEWILTTKAFDSQQLAGYITSEVKLSNITADFKKDILDEFDKRIPALSLKAQQFYPQFLINSFFFCIDYQSDSNQEFKLPLTLLDDLVSSSYFDLNSVSNEQPKQMPLHTVVQRIKQNDQYHEGYQYALGALLKHKNISNAINASAETKEQITPLCDAIKNHDMETSRRLIDKNASHHLSAQQLMEFSKIFSEDDFFLILKSSFFIQTKSEAYDRIRKDSFESAAKNGLIRFLLGAYRLVEVDKLTLPIELALKKYLSMDHLKTFLPYEQQLECMHVDNKLARSILLQNPEEFIETLDKLDDFHSKIEHTDYQTKYPLSLFGMAKECIQDEKKSVHLEPLLKSQYFSKDLQASLLYEILMSIKDEKEENLPLQRLLSSPIEINNHMFYKGKPIFETIINECVDNKNNTPLIILLKSHKIKIDIPDEKGVYLMDTFINKIHHLPHLTLLVDQGAKNQCSYSILKNIYANNKFTSEHVIPVFKSYIDINKPFPNGLTLAEYAIFDGHYSIVSRSFRYGANINRGLALCGIKGIYNLKKGFHWNKKYTNDLRLHQELNKYIQYKKLFSIYFCDVMIDILKLPCPLQPDAWKIIVQNSDFKDRLFEFIQSLSNKTQAHIFKESFVEGTALYTIWNTARREGHPPTIYSGMLGKVYSSNQFFKDKPQNTIEQVIEEILHYKKTLLRKNHSIDLTELLDKKNEFCEPDKYEINTLLPIELAILHNKTEEIFKLFYPLKDYFIAPYNNNSKIYPLRYTLALCGEEKLQSLMKELLRQQGSKAVALHNNLQLAVKEMNNHFEIFYQDILNGKISPHMVIEITEKFPEFSERMIAYAKSKGIKTEHEMLKYTLTTPSALSALLIRAPKEKRSDLYTRMNSLNEKIKTEDKKLSNETCPYSPEDPMRNKLYIKFKTLLKKYDKHSYEKGTAEHKRLQNKIDICYLALDILEKRVIPEDVLNELPQRDSSKLWDYLENKYKDKNVFRKGFLSFLHNDLAFSFKELIAYQNKIMQTVSVPPVSEIYFADSPSLISAPKSTLVPSSIFTLVSAPMSTLVPSSISTLVSAPMSTLVPSSISTLVSAPMSTLVPSPISTLVSVPTSTFQPLPAPSAPPTEQEMIISCPISFFSTTNIDKESSNTIYNNFPLQKESIKEKKTDISEKNKQITAKMSRLSAVFS